MTTPSDTPFNMFPTTDKPSSDVSTESIEPDLAEPEPFTFTMSDVCSELENLKNQILETSAGSSAAPETSTLVSLRQKKRLTNSKRASNAKLIRNDSKLTLPVSVAGPWGYFNRDADFITFKNLMKKVDESRLISLAAADLGNRISHHKEKSQAKGDPIHVYYKGKLNELKDDLDVSKALVLLFVFRRMPAEKIDALERKLFPLPARVLMTAAQIR